MTPTAIHAEPLLAGAPVRRRTTPRAAVQAFTRLVALVLLVGLAVVALRTRLPAPGPAAARTGGGSAVAVLVALLVASVAVLSLALFARARGRPQIRASSERERRRWPRRVWSRRDLVWIAAAAVVLTGALLLPVAGRMVDRPQPRPVPPPTSQTADRPPPPATPAPPQRAGTDGPWWTISVIALPTMLALIGAGVLLGFRRDAGRDAGRVGGRDIGRVGSPALSEHENLTRAAELALATVAGVGRDPRSAIIACYAVMESALAGTVEAAPEASDTPSEVLARAVARGVVGPESAGPLVGLFTEARFSIHPMTERHRALAETQLRSVLTELRSRACVPGNHT